MHSKTHRDLCIHLHRNSYEKVSSELSVAAHVTVEAQGTEWLAEDHGDRARAGIEPGSEPQSRALSPLHAEEPLTLLTRTHSHFLNL